MGTKHTEACPPYAASLDMYPDQQPEIVPVDITEYTLMKVVGKLSEGAGREDGLCELPTMAPDIRSGERGFSSESCSSPRWDNLPSGHQRNPLLGLILQYMHWGQKYFSEKIETYQYMQKKEVHVLMGSFYSYFQFIGKKMVL